MISDEGKGKRFKAYVCIIDVTPPLQCAGINRHEVEDDSTFDGFDQDGASLTLRFSAAYIHESDGKPGLDAGVDWIQEVRLHFENASITGAMSKLPCFLWDGQLSLADESIQMIPVPLEYTGKVKLKLD
jgi:hypothetical protein